MVAAVIATLFAVSVSACSDSEDEAATTRAVTSTQSPQPPPPQTEVQNAKPPPPPKPPTSADQKQIYAELARLRDQGLSGAEVYRRAAEAAGVPVSSVKLIERQGSLRRWALPKAPKPPPAAVRAGRPWGATRLRSTTSCSSNAPRTAIAHLRWRPARPAGRTQWIVVTNLLRGFEFGKYEAAGPAEAAGRVVRLAARARAVHPPVASADLEWAPLAGEPDGEVHRPDLRRRVRAVVFLGNSGETSCQAQEVLTELSPSAVGEGDPSSQGGRQ